MSLPMDVKRDLARIQQTISSANQRINIHIRNYRYPENIDQTTAELQYLHDISTQFQEEHTTAKSTREQIISNYIKSTDDGKDEQTHTNLIDKHMKSTSWQEDDDEFTLTLGKLEDLIEQVEKHKEALTRHLNRPSSTPVTSRRAPNSIQDPTYTHATRTQPTPIHNNVSAPNQSIDNGQPQSHITTTNTDNQQQPQPTYRQRNINLPTFQVPKYNGEEGLFEQFWDSYDSAIHQDVTLSEPQKFMHLKTLLGPETRQLLHNIDQQTGYQSAIQLLKKLFHNPQGKIYDITQQIKNFEHTSDNIEDIRKAYFKVFANVKNLEALGETTDTRLLIATINDIWPPRLIAKLKQNLTQARIFKSVQIDKYLDEVRNAIDDLSIDDEKKRQRETQSFSYHNQRHDSRGRPPTRDHPRRDHSSGNNRHRSYSHNSNSSNRQRSTSSEYRAHKQYTDTSSCIFCKKDHTLWKCPLSTNDRRRALGRKCWKCFKNDHIAKFCKDRNCSVCQREHHAAICYEKRDRSSGRPRSTSRSSHNYTTFFKNNSKLMTITAEAIAQDHTKHNICILLDSGAQHSLISEQLAIKLQLPTVDSCKMTMHTMGNQQTTFTSSLHQLHLTKLAARTPLLLYSAPTLTTQLPEVHIQKEDLRVLEKNNHKLHNYNSTETPDVVIGIDYYWDLVNMETPVTNLPSGLKAIPTVLGTVIAGAPHKQQKSHFFHFSKATTPDNPNDMPELWELDTIGISDDPHDQTATEDPTEIYNSFKETIEFREDRPYVRLPWKSTKASLGDNKNLAYKRLLSLYNKHHNNPLWTQYNNILTEQRANGTLEECSEESNGPLYYIPHQPVIKQSSETTKVRIVLDASSHCKDKPSLNDVLYQGPNYIPNICGNLLRARTHQFLVTADVEKAFLQVGLHESDRDATRILWLKDPTRPPSHDNLTTLRYTRLPFGLNSSPFLLAATIKLYLEKRGEPICQRILRNLYVDNLTLGSSSVRSATADIASSKRIFNELSMNLREYASNSKQASATIPRVDRAKSTTQKLLGTTWDTLTDNLILQFQSNRTATTKRTIIADLYSIYDPLGLLSPIAVELKLFTRNLSEYSWDEPLNNDIITQWGKLKSKVFNKQFHIPRPLVNVNNVTTFSLAIFCDASKHTYGTCAYIVPDTDKQRTPQLVMSKSRLAPDTNISIPRLELISLVCASQLARFLIAELDLNISQVHFYSDSQVTLYWLHDHTLLKIFVANRVKTINDNINSIKNHDITTTFHYVKTTENPADLTTRGSFDILNNQLWLQGPHWMQTQESFKLYPQFKQPQQQPPDAATEQRTTTVSLGAVIEENRFSHLHKLTSCISTVLTYIREKVWKKVNDNLKRILDNAIPELNMTTNDIHPSLHLAIRQHQKEVDLSTTGEHFVDSNGITRAVFRLSQAPIPEAAKRPILLQKDHPLTKLIINDIHISQYHSGTESTLATFRQKFWTTSTRKTIHNIINRCLHCKRLKVTPYRYPQAPDLPQSRFSTTNAFTHIGLDYLGPIRTYNHNNDTTKCYVALFTCLSTRAVHLEVTVDQTTKEFLRAFRMFIARRGTPRSVLSDNAPTFLLGRDILNEIITEAKEALESRSTIDVITWRTITPLAPWQGGIYERLVALVKQALHRTFLNHTLHIRDFIVAVTEIEAVINNRPLTHTPTGLNDDIIAIRPIDMLQPQLSIEFPRTTTDILSPLITSKEEANRWISSLQHTINFFWELWKKTYIDMLKERHERTLKQKHTSDITPQVGDIVLVHANTPRHTWPIARVLELLPDEDGRHRTATITSNNGRKYKRAISLLFPLELDTIDTNNTPHDDTHVKNDDVTTQTVNRKSVVTSRPQRIKKKTVRFDPSPQQ